MNLETIGAASVGGTIGAFKSITILVNEPVNAIPEWSEMVHTAILALIGAVVAILAQWIYRKIRPRK